MGEEREPKKILPRIGQVVSVVIRKVYSGGLFVEVTDWSARGIIRTREIASTQVAAPDEWKTMYVPGAGIQAMVIDHHDDGRLELSIRQIRQDPWRSISGRLQVGQLVDGVVVNVEHYGAFVELVQGVTGLLHISRLPVGLSGDVSDLFLPGDRVKVVVEAIDESERRISLTMHGLADRRWLHIQSPEATETQKPSQKSDATSPNSGIEKLPIELLMERPPQRILVIEDDEVHRQQVANWLRRAGQHVETAESGENALDVFTDFHPDVALIDVGLPGIDGAETVRRLIKIHPEVRAVLMTADLGYVLDVHKLEVEGFKVLPKPLRAHELLDVLYNLFPANGKSRNRLALDTSAGSDVVLSTTTSELSEDIANTIQSLVERTKAKKAVLFSLDPVQRKVEILAHHGPGRLDFQALPGLLRSPVRDVAEDDILVRTDDAHDEHEDGQFRYLRPLLQFSSCIGASTNANLPMQTAIFIFHTRKAAFSAAHKDVVVAYALALKNILERDAFVRQSSELQRLALLGQLSRALVHEVNHRLSPVDFALDTVQAEFRDIEKLIDKLPQTSEQGLSSIETDFRQANESLGHLAHAVRALIETAKLFGKMAKTSQESEILVLTEVAKEVADLMRDTAQKHYVRIHLDTPAKLMATRTQVTLVRQVLLNVVLNAIQQIGLYRPREGGNVRISFSERWDAQKHMVCIHVEDDGPGIHRRLWKQVFQLGYTTRKDGSGLGLHISQSLVESLGGQISVSESLLYWGTTFTVDLPFKS